MERRVIEIKLDNLGNCLQRIESKMPASAQILKTDFDIQDIISLNLERAIQSCIDIASHLVADMDDVSGLSAASIFLELVSRDIISEKLGERLAKAAGFRNLLVHRYASIDWERVFNNLKTELHVFRDFAGQVEKHSEL